MPLNDLQARNAAPRDKPYKLSVERGLYLLVEPNGRKYWRMKYRHAGKEKLLAIGVYPDVPLKEARLKASKQRELLQAGVDPSLARKQAKHERLVRAENTFEAIARQWQARGTGNGGRTWDAGHAAKVLTSLEQDVFPEIGSRPLVELTAPEILRAVRLVEKRGALDIAKRVLQRIGAVYRYAIQEGIATTNPARDLSGAIKTRQSENHAALGAGELPEFLKRLAAYDGQPLTRSALQLVLLTFVRTAELRGARWDEFDVDAAEWRIPAARMKMKELHVVPLSTQALALIEEIRTMTGKREFVFPNQANPAKCMSENTMLYAVYRMGYHQRATVHGFRATASTILNELGYPADVIEKQLAHGERNKVRAAYNHATYLPERRRMMQQWSDLLDTMTTSEKVVPIRRSIAAA